MKKYNKKLISLFTIITIFLVSISFAIKGIESYANEYGDTKTYTVSTSIGKSSTPRSKSTGYKSYKTNTDSYSNKSKLPSSGSFNSGGSTNKNNTTIIKPDSGGFTTKPSDNSNSTIKPDSHNSTTIKPDSGSFTTKPKEDTSLNKDKNTGESKNYKEYDDYDSSKGNYSGGGFFGGYFNPFRSFGYGRWYVSSWIVNIVIIITVIVIAYILIDYLRNRRR